VLNKTTRGNRLPDYSGFFYYLERDMKYRYFFLVIGLLFMLLACKQPESESGGGYAPPIGEHMKMVHFKLTSLTDNTVLDSKQLEGQVLLVTFFATWCPPCIQEIPSFIAVQDSFRTKGFSVVAFSLDEGGPEPLYNLIKKYGINYPVMLADLDVARGFGGVTGIPVTFVVNRKGEIVKKYLGYVEHDVLEEEVKLMLAEG
jgi:thiol-disulfide isomerase/thioredoxin